jgi:predicted phosphoadenosine phosphosulfate sulfurtransferase
VFSIFSDTEELVSGGINMTERRMKRTRHRQTIEQNVYDAAIERTHHIFDNHDTVAVAFSGGKDSTATLNVVLEVAKQRGHDKPIRVIFYDEEAIPFETEQYVRRVGQRDDVQLEWYCIPFIGNNHCSRSAPIWYPWAEEDEDKWVRPLPPEAIRWWDIPGFSRTLHTYEVNGLLFDPKVDGMTALCLGIRAQESMTRLRAVTRKVTDNYIIEYNEITSKGNLFKAYPIYDWVTEDVWTAPQKFGWDYNCNTAEAPIWMGDFSFKPIEKVQPGDEVIGWTSENGKRAVLCPSTVLRCGAKEANVVKITMESGRTVRCTADHLWASLPTGVNSYQPARVGRPLLHVIEPSYRTASLSAAWLGGLYDGEGCGDRIYQSPTHNPDVYARIEAILTELEIPYVRLNGNSAAQHGFRITNGRQGLVDFFNTTGAIRRGRHVDKSVLSSRFRKPDNVLTIEPDGREPVYWLETTTGNYVAWGYASKNSAYDAMELAGLSITHQRCSPPYANEPLQKLWTYKVCFPDVWDKMCARVPGAATAARYAKTELYGFSKRPKKPDGVPWETWIVELINQWPPEERPVVAQRVKNEFGKHFGKTSDPIAATAPHPISGITWDFVVMLAMRGDKLNRKTPTVKVGGLSPEQLEALRVKYDAQIADMKERGEL